jgi:plasmid stabilization system protein ParE
VKLQVLISVTASKDVDRLEAWLLDKNPGAALRVAAVLHDAIGSLQEMPERGRLVASALRELNAKFGRGIYVIRYQVRDRHVVVTRIFHGRERR